MRSRWNLAGARTAVVLGLVCLCAGLAIAQVNPNEYAGLVWRNIGPFRAGRISAVSAPIGPGQAGIFDDALPAGGVWKTENAGMTWFPIFDAIKTVSSVGAIAVAPSDPNIIYVGTATSSARARSTRVTACTSRPTPARPGCTSASRRPSRSRRSSWIPRIRTLCCWRRKATFITPAMTAASSAPPTAGKPGSRCSSATTLPAGRMSNSRMTIPTSSSPPPYCT